MSEESTTHDLVELTRRRVAAVDSVDIDAMTGFFASDAVWDSTPMGLEVYEGKAAIRRFFDVKLRDGKVVYFFEYEHRAEALTAVGLET